LSLVKTTLKVQNVKGENYYYSRSVEFWKQRKHFSTFLILKPLINKISCDNTRSCYFKRALWLSCKAKIFDEKTNI